MISRRAVLATGVAVLAHPRFARAEEGRLSFSADLTQGGLVVGKAAAGAQITVDGKSVLVSEAGIFAFGFSYNQTAPVRVSARYADGATDTRDVAPASRSYAVQRIDGLPKNQVVPPPDVLARIKRESAAIEAARTNDTPHDWFAGGFQWPAAGIVSSVYGSQRILDGVPMAPHLGVDISALEGTPIHAPANAVVSLAEPDFYLDGGLTLLDHGQGISTCYVHQQRLYVKPGDTVRQGDVIGLIGKTGRATGPNLHWGLNWFQLKLDPSLSTATPLPPRS